MKSSTKFVSALSDAQRASLEQLYRQGSAHRLRQRAQAILLSARGSTLEQLAGMYEVHPETVSKWLDQWQERGVEGLADAPKPGRRRKIDAALEAELLDLLQNPTPDLKAVVQAHLKKKTSRSAGTP
jgi:transposase